MKYLILSISILTLFACNSESHSTDHTSDAISLNNGEKWPVNAEMKPFIEKGHEILAEYEATNGTDYKALANDLKEQNGQLIKSCTMKGEAHDELHKWLYPHMESISNLAKAQDANQAKEQISQLKKSFETYHKYFN